MLNTLDKQQALAPYTAERTWIGFHRDPTDTAHWLWVDGSSANYTNWAKEEPNNAGELCRELCRENCVEMYPPSLVPAGKWNDISCNTSLAYVCEITGESSMYESVTSVHMPPGISRAFFYIAHRSGDRH